MASDQHSSVEAQAGLLGISGIDRLEDLQPRHLNRRVNPGLVMNYAQFYPGIEPGCFLHEGCAPEDWRQARADRWQ